MSPHVPGCPPPEDIERLLASADSTGLIGPVAEHVRICPSCRSLADVIRHNNSLLREFAGACSSSIGEELTDGHAGATIADSSVAALPSDSFTGYQLLREIHRGGQGVVYQAIQKSTRRKVAIKVMKEGPFAGAGDRARFEREVQMLGMLQHPHIVAIHDTGQAAGHFYYVMDYIAGQPLDTHMAGGTWTIKQTLELFAEICEAVNAAHLRGIIHRDLKPGNIRVDERGEPHVLDFGLAKAATPPASSPTQGDAEIGIPVGTMTGQFVGSLPWASPEQAEGKPGKIDLRTDVYSLGVILYQMLTGKFPYDVVGPLHQVLERIVNAEPPAPGRLGWRGRSARERINDEVDNIVLKCLQKERDRRYQTAGELARDVRRYLAGEPVLAVPLTAGYQIRKFARRHRVAVATGSFVVATLVMGVLGTTCGLLRALDETARAVRAEQEQGRERERADREADAARAAEAEQRRLAEAESKARRRAEAINDFVTKALQSSDPTVGRNQETTVAEAMTRAVQEIWAGAFEDEPETEAGLLNAIANILCNNGRAAEAEPLALQAMATYQRLYEGDRAELASSMSHHARCLDSLGRPAEALPEHEAALAMWQRLFESDHPDVANALNNVAFSLRSLGQLSKALSKFEEALAMQQRLYERDHRDVATSLNNVAACLKSLGRAAEALPKYEAALEMRRRLFHGDHPDVATSLNNLASCLKSLGRTSEALPIAEEALEMYQRLFQGDHPLVATSLNNLAFSLQSLGRSTEALLKYEAALEMRQRLFQGDHPDVATSLYNLGACLISLDRAAEALPRVQSALEIRQRLFKGDHPAVAEAMNNVAYTLQMLGRAAEAEPMHVQALEMRRRIFKGDHPAVAGSLTNLGLVLRSLERAAEAEPYHRQALEMRQRLFNGDHPVVAESLSDLAACLCDLEDWAEALPMFESALGMRRRILPPGHPHTLTTQMRFARALVTLRRFNEAEPLLLDAAEHCDRSVERRRTHWRSVVKQSIELYEICFLAISCG